MKTMVVLLSRCTNCFYRCCRIPTKLSKCKIVWIN